MAAVEITPGRAGTARGGVRLLAFAGLVTVANALLVGNYGLVGQGPAPEWPVMFDLLLFVPLVYLALNWRQGKDAVLKALSLSCLGALAGSLILPDESKNAWLIVEDLRFAALAVIVLIQSGLIVLLVSQVVGRRDGQNLEASLDSAIGNHFGHTAFARLLRLESRVWLYGLCRHPVRQAFPGLAHFHASKQGMNASNQAAFLVLFGVEIPIAHLLIHLFDPVVAVVVTVVSVYGFLFMLADYRATLHRPLSVTDRGLQVRYGVASDFLLDWPSIATAERSCGPVRRARGRIRLAGMGESNVLIKLAPGTRVPGLTGSRIVDEVFLGVDDPAGLIAAIRDHRIGH